MFFTSSVHWNLMFLTKLFSYKKRVYSFKILLISWKFLLKIFNVKKFEERKSKLNFSNIFLSWHGVILYIYLKCNCKNIKKYHFFFKVYNSESQMCIASWSVIKAGVFLLRLMLSRVIHQFGIWLPFLRKKKPPGI